MAFRDPLVAAVHECELTADTPNPETLPPLARAARILGHDFSRPDLLQEALTHRSALGGARRSVRGRSSKATSAGSNERLEFVGDRVLGLLVAEWLAERFPKEQEGELGPRLAHLVSQPVLAEIAERLGLPPVLSVAPGEAGVRRLATVLADAMEAMIGALYLDAGLDAARRFVRGAWEPAMTGLVAPPKDAKTGLQEWLLGRGMSLPTYVEVSRDGPPHDPMFVIAVEAAGQSGTGRAGSKRAAERIAAEDLLRKLQA